MIGEEGSITLLMGNEAVARGAIEAGVNIAIGYPGTPSSEVISTLVLLAGEAGMRAEWAVNEKVAFDIATGASFTGLRCLVPMKSAGLNVASDSVISVAYGDVNGGLVIYVADDPGAHAGMEETDSRQYSCISLLPMIDVTDPQDAKNAIVAAFDYSEEYKIPVFVRSTSSVAHMRGNVTLGPVEKVEREKRMERDIRRFTRASPVWCQEQHALLNERVERMRSFLEASEGICLSLLVSSALKIPMGFLGGLPGPSLWYGSQTASSMSCRSILDRMRANFAILSTPREAWLRG